MIAIEIDHFPLVLLDMGPGGRTPEEFRRMFAAFREANQRAIKERGSYVLVATTDAVPTAAERKIVVDEANRFSASEYKLVSSVVLVVPNRVIRGVVTALGWMIPQIPPLETAPTTQAAVELAVSKLRGCGIEYPEERASRARRWFQRSEPAPVRRREEKGAS